VSSASTTNNESSTALVLFRDDRIQEIGIAPRPAPPPTEAPAASEHPPRLSETGPSDAIASFFSIYSRSSASTTAKAAAMQRLEIHQK
jgi:hypothetical protein